MKGRKESGKGRKKSTCKWGTGDMLKEDEVLFKYLPNPEEITKPSEPTIRRSKIRKVKEK